MADCPECGADVTPQMNYCQECGAELVWPDGQEITTNSGASGGKLGRAVKVLLILLGVLAVLAIGSMLAASFVLGLAGEGASGTGAGATPAADIPTHDIGDTFTVRGNGQQIRYTVESAQTTDSVGDGITAVEADGVFVVVELEMTNVADTTTEISSRNFLLIDGEERQYETDSDALLAHEDNVVFEQLDPSVTQSGVLIFDVPEDQASRGLIVTTDTVGKIDTGHLVILERGVAT